MTDYEKFLSMRAEHRKRVYAPEVREVPRVEQVVVRKKRLENDRIVDYIELEERPIADKFKGYKVSDFFLENLQAAGVELDEVSLHDGFGFGYADKAIDAVESIASAINNGQNNEE